MSDFESESDMERLEFVAEVSAANFIPEKKSCFSKKKKERRERGTHKILEINVPKVFSLNKGRPH